MLLIIFGADLLDVLKAQVSTKSNAYFSLPSPSQSSYLPPCGFAFNGHNASLHTKNDSAWQNNEVSILFLPLLSSSSLFRSRVGCQFRDGMYSDFLEFSLGGLSDRSRLSVHREGVYIESWQHVE